jgi:hypothetical protein
MKLLTANDWELNPKRLKNEYREVARIVDYVIVPK